jgi:hypothetical protein
MKHHHKEEAENFDYVYYLVGLVCGLFVGFIIDKGFTWIPVGGVLGLLTAAFFLQVMVKKEQGDA